jgi:hypothetical protein
VNFLEAFREQVEKRKSRSGRRLLKRLGGMTARRRARVVARMEAHARVELKSRGYAVGATWDTVGERDWDKFFESLVKFLSALMPFLLMFISLPPWLVPWLVAASLLL